MINEKVNHYQARRHCLSRAKRAVQDAKEAIKAGRTTLAVLRLKQAEVNIGLAAGINRACSHNLSRTLAEPHDKKHPVRYPRIPIKDPRFTIARSAWGERLIREALL